MEITKELATQIVTAIYEVVKRDINFIDPDGRIIGSSDQKRIGDFHQAGAYAAKEKKRMMSIRLREQDRELIIRFFWKIRCWV